MDAQPPQDWEAAYSALYAVFVVLLLAVASARYVGPDKAAPAPPRPRQQPRQTPTQTAEDDEPEQKHDLAACRAAVAEARRLMADDWPLRAEQQLSAAERGAAALARGGDAEAARLRDEWAAAADLEPIRRCKGELSSVLRELEESESWTVHSVSKGGVTTSTRAEPDGQVSFKVEGEVAADLFAMLACLLETDLMKDWLPMCTASERLRSPTKFRQVVRLVFPMWWPMKDRENILLAYGQALPGRGVAVYLVSDEETVPDSGQFHRMGLEGGMLLVPLPGGKCEMRCVFRVDLRMKLPASLVNYFVQNFCGYLLPMHAKMSRKFAEGQPLHARITDNPEVYGEVRRRLAELLRSL